MTNYRSNTYTGLAGIGVVLFVLLAFTLTVLFNGWIVMVVFGALASIFGWSTISFTQGIIVGVVLSLLGSFFKSRRDLQTTKPIHVALPSIQRPTQAALWRLRMWG